MDEDDIDYYRHRRQEEMRAADRASDMRCRAVHLEFARLYGLRLAEASAGRSIHAETSPCALSAPAPSSYQSVRDGFDQEFA